MNSARQEWYEEDYDAGLDEGRWGEIDSARRAGKQMNQFLIQLHDNMSKPLAEMGKAIKPLAEMGKAISKALGNVQFDPHTPTRPPHSMTPPEGRSFDRRGRKRY